MFSTVPCPRFNIPCPTLVPCFMTSVLVSFPHVLCPIPDTRYSMLNVICPGLMYIVQVPCPRSHVQLSCPKSHIIGLVSYTWSHVVGLICQVSCSMSYVLGIIYQVSCPISGVSSAMSHVLGFCTLFFYPVLVLCPDIHVSWTIYLFPFSTYFILWYVNACHMSYCRMSFVPCPMFCVPWPGSISLKRARNIETGHFQFPEMFILNFSS